MQATVDTQRLSKMGFVYNMFVEKLMTETHLFNTYAKFQKRNTTINCTFVMLKHANNWCSNPHASTFHVILANLSMYSLTYLQYAKQCTVQYWCLEFKTKASRDKPLCHRQLVQSRIQCLPLHSRLSHSYLCHQAVQ